MAGKKQPGRFTIQFSPADPQQRQVIELLNQQGRRKAAFLTSAVLSYYCGKNVPPPVSVSQQVDLLAIEQVVRKVLQENPQPNLQPMTTSQSIEQQAPPKEVPKAERMSQEAELPEDVLSAIGNMIDVFRGEAGR